MPGVREMTTDGEGYRLAAVLDADEVRCVAGFRSSSSVRGRHLHVDGLVIAEDARSEGHGARMLRWLEGLAREEGCASVQLGSGARRKDARRFCEREGFAVTSYHFVKEL
jgi:GNAT superfamily N-acetyltransferase